MMSGKNLKTNNNQSQKQNSFPSLKTKTLQSKIIKKKKK